jgi:2,4-dichlorophenol 6-monooxygenase
MTASRILDGDYHDPRSAWQRHRQIASDGAILVRPDRFIAWRSPAAGGEPRAVLAAALSQILGRGPSARAESAGFLAGRVPRSADDSLSPAGPRC